MNWTVRQLGAPVRYLRIAQGSGLFTSKATYDFVLPLVLAALATTAVRWFSITLGLYAADGLIPGVIDLLNLLIAFFIAALAAVATFDRPGLDDKMKGEPALMRRRDSKGVIRDCALTHRQFICYLFGYLSFSSIMLLLGLYMLRLIGTDVAAALDLTLTIGTIHVDTKALFKTAAVFAFFFVFAQIVVAMLLGIYFLTDRLQFLDDPND